MYRRLVYVWGCVLFLGLAQPALAASDIVLRATDAKNLRGNWTIASDSSAAGSQYISSYDYGWATTDAPKAQPNDYFEVSFSAPAGTPYHVWFRMRAAGNVRSNDSVWVQYSDALSPNGAPVYGIGSTSGLNVVLERASGAGVSGWGWQDSAYWMSQATTVKFATTGTHTIRVQVREDGAQIDQIVLSPTTYLYASPGQMTNDTVVVPLSGGTTTTTTSTPTTTPAAAASTASTTAGPYLGSPIALPGRIEAENFDAGNDGVSYHDNTAGNAGGAYRQTNADIETCSEGGYDIGWIAAGEWMNYTVTAPAGGSYTVKLRVASPSGGSLHVGFNGPSSVWASVTVPATGGWQNWTTVNVPVRLGAGSQQLTLVYDTAGFNVNYIDVAAGTTSATSTSTPPPPPTTTGSGASVPVVTWNLHIDSSSSHAQQAMVNLMTLNPKPQIIVVQEAYQPLLSTYLSTLQSKSGVAWQAVMQTHCPPGAWNGSSCTSSELEGVAVLTSLPIISSSRTLLPYADQWHSARALVRVAVNVGGVTLQVFGAHLQSNNATARYNSMAMLKSYAGNYSTPQIVAGDFNADMDQIDTAQGMYPNFTDTWKLVGSGSGCTAFTPSPTMKIDYWFTDAGQRAKPDWTVVLNNFGTFSDHLPVMASFTVR